MTSWIKMRGNLWDDPRVSRLCDLTGESEAAVVGGLYWLWNTADQHTENGVLPGLTLAAIDRKTGVKGLAEGLVAIGWLADHPEGVRIVNFEEHNGASAKRRSEDARRKSGVRKDSDKTRTDDGNLAESSGGSAELDKRREDKSREEDSVAKATDGDAVKTKVADPDEIIFGYGVPLLTAAGTSEKHARSFLGGLRKVAGDVAVVNALRECIRAKPLQPLEWLAKALPPAEREGKTHETAYQRTQRERVNEFAPGIAKRKPGLSTIDEVSNVSAVASR